MPCEGYGGPKAILMTMSSLLLFDDVLITEGGGRASGNADVCPTLPLLSLLRLRSHLIGASSA